MHSRALARVQVFQHILDDEGGGSGHALAGLRPGGGHAVRASSAAAIAVRMRAVLRRRARRAHEHHCSGLLHPGLQKHAGRLLWNGTHPIQARVDRLYVPEVRQPPQRRTWVFCGVGDGGGAEGLPLQVDVRAYCCPTNARCERQGSVYKCMPSSTHSTSSSSTRRRTTWRDFLWFLFFVIVPISAIVWCCMAGRRRQQMQQAVPVVPRPGMYPAGVAGIPSTSPYPGTSPYAAQGVPVSTHAGMYPQPQYGNRPQQGYGAGALAGTAGAGLLGGMMLGNVMGGGHGGWGGDRYDHGGGGGDGGFAADSGDMGGGGFDADS